MIGTILKAKHWQLFILIFGLPFLVYLFTIYNIISSISQETGPDPAFLIGYMKYFFILGIISMIIYWVWYWSVGVGLQRKLPEGVKMPVNTFKIFLIFPAFYIAVVAFFMLYIMNSTLDAGVEPFNPALIVLIIPFHLFSIFCVFYCIYFTAKTIKSVELQRDVKFSDFIAEFFLVWFFPIGVWILQPTINKLTETGMDDFDDIL